MTYYMGIDVGTSSVKGILAGPEGLVAQASRDLKMEQPAPGWAEQNPEDWWQAVVPVVRELFSVSRIPVTELAGIGLTGQMHGLCCLDGSGHPLRPAILWCDQRTGEVAESMSRQMEEARLAQLSGNRPVAGFTLAKLLWVRAHEPEVFAATRKILLPKDYIRFRLTGRYGTEVSDASGMQLLDIRKRRFSPEILQAYGIPPEMLPEVTESQEVSGTVSREAASVLGIPSGIPVVGGAGDQAAAALGNGVAGPGMASLSFGTSGVVFAATGEPVRDPESRIQTFCHAVPDTWHVMGVTQAAGLSLQWFRDRMAPDILREAERTGGNAFDLLVSGARTVSPGSAGLVYLPYLMGERTPHLDSSATGVFFGINASHGREHFFRAVLEGVAFSIAHNIQVAREVGAQISELRAVGGPTRSPLWCQIIADITGQPLTVLRDNPGAPLGNVFLAAAGVGLIPDAGVAAAQAAVVDRVYFPDPAYRHRYDCQFAIYRELYPSLKPQFAAAAQL